MLMWYFETWVVFFQMLELSNFQKSVTYIKKILMDVINLRKFHKQKSFNFRNCQVLGHYQPLKSYW